VYFLTGAINIPWVDDLRRTERLPESYTAMVFDYVAPLAERIRELHGFLGRPIVNGINGAQGSGKSTLALFLANWLKRELGLTTVSLSLDALYLSKAAREDLAKKWHPLLRTRGVPGTHDVALGIESLKELTEEIPNHVVTLPGFDKARDDRVKQSDLRCVDAPVDVVLFEGWCVGARPQPDCDLITPVNSLEAEDDVDGIWRSYVNEKLGHEYAGLFERLDALVMLRIPSFDKVLEWREQQEQKLREKSATGMNSAELRHFVMHFERLTRHMLEDMPDYANTVIDIDDSHNMVGMSHINWPFERDLA
jgi:D-glycerate 3-kinase